MLMLYRKYTEEGQGQKQEVQWGGYYTSLVKSW